MCVPLPQQKGLVPAYMAGFRGGAVMGMAVVSTALAAAALLQLLTGNADFIMAFSLGASSLVLLRKPAEILPTAISLQT